MTRLKSFGIFVLGKSPVTIKYIYWRNDDHIIVHFLMSFFFVRCYTECHNNTYPQAYYQKTIWAVQQSLMLTL